MYKEILETYAKEHGVKVDDLTFLQVLDVCNDIAPHLFYVDFMTVKMFGYDIKDFYGPDEMRANEYRDFLLERLKNDERPWLLWLETEKAIL